MTLIRIATPPAGSPAGWAGSISPANDGVKAMKTQYFFDLFGL
jgi:hypothetical protein